MHRKNYLSVRIASFKRMFEAHALVHHKHYAEILAMNLLLPVKTRRSG
jgi:hypothetical protein